MVTYKLKFENLFPTSAKRRFFVFSLLFILFCSEGKNLFAQCISTFPYTEGFETLPAWTPGGTNSDWAWGAPSHPTISSAGGGTKCWMVGGLTGTFYNFSEQSTLQSPCFDFSSLNYPWISLKIFWEDEWKFDGMVLQSSINGGASWQNVGAYNDPVDCMNANWYNYNNITWLTSIPVKHGWCGRIGPTVSTCQGGNGSAGWVTAKHCLSSLAGQPNVIFRFLFGAGTTCNGYDGIAIDDIFIGNAPPEVPVITYACAGGNTVGFSGTSNPCPISYAWDFGDPASGPANISSLQNPVHTFSTSGTYTITLVTNGPCNPAGTTSVSFSILGATTSVTNISCNSLANGVASVNITGGSGPFTYNWSPSGGNTATASNLSPGNYTVTVTAPNSCPTNASVLISQPSALIANTSQNNVLCNGGNSGSASVSISGGTGPYAYTWSPSGGNAATANNLVQGNYSCTITDANGCQITQSFIITEPTPLFATSSFVAPTCGNANGSAAVVPAGGAGNYTYAWNPLGGNTANAINLGSGTYNCTITDANGCTVTQSVSLPNSSGVSLSTSSSINILCFGGNNGSAQVLATGINTPFNYVWSNGNLTSSSTGLTAGTYTVSVTDANNCTDTVHIIISQPPALILTASASSNSICSGQAISLNAIASGGTPNYTIVWSPGNLMGATQNIIPNASGNYTANVIDQNGCNDSSSLFINVNAIPISNFSNDIFSGCAPVCVQFSDASNIASPATINSWSWEFGDGNVSTSQNPNHCYSSAGIYSVNLLVTSDNGCSATFTINNLIQVFGNPEAQFTYSPNAPTFSDPTIYFSDQSQNASSWNWTFGDHLNSNSILQNPSFNYSEATCYEVNLTVTSADGCLDTATQEICIKLEVAFYEPNSFTPNGDGSNDFFFPKGEGMDWTTFHMMIFDRWGNLIFETDALQPGWDGKAKGGSQLAQEDVYVWKIDVRDNTGALQNFIGHVSLIR